MINEITTENNEPVFNKREKKSWKFFVVLAALFALFSFCKNDGCIKERYAGIGTYDAYTCERYVFDKNHIKITPATFIHQRPDLEISYDLDGGAVRRESIEYPSNEISYERAAELVRECQAKNASVPNGQRPLDDESYWQYPPIF